jgi:hypothetical protein
LGDAPDGRDFIDGFQSERDKKQQSELKARGVQKRFANCTFGNPASVLYKVFSAYSVHGGIGSTLLRSAQGANTFSCGFVSREAQAQDFNQFQLLVTGCEILLIEPLNIHAAFGKEYGVMSPELREAAIMLAELGTTGDSPSPEKSRQVNELLARLLEP